MKIICFCFLFFCSAILGAATEKNNRELAKMKRTESVDIYWRQLISPTTKSGDSLLTAIALIDEAIALDSSYIIAYLTKSQMLNERNLSEESKKTLDLGIYYNPDNPDLFFVRGIVYEKLQQYELANKDYQRSLDLFNQKIIKDPDDYSAIRDRSIVLFLLESKENAIKELKSLYDKPLNEKEKKELYFTLELIKNRNRKEFIQDFN